MSMSLESMTVNPDLAWDLDDFAHRQRAMDFVMQFEHTLCVYSPTVAQIYSTYNMYFPKDMERRLVILPDPTAFHDTFNRIAHEAVTATGLHIVPGELIETEGLFIANVNEGRELSKRKVPFETALRTIMANRSGRRSIFAGASQRRPQRIRAILAGTPPASRQPEQATRSLRPRPQLNLRRRSGKARIAVCGEPTPYGKLKIA